MHDKLLNWMECDHIELTFPSASRSFAYLNVLADEVSAQLIPFCH